MTLVRELSESTVCTRIPFRNYHSLLFKLWTLCIFESPFGGLRGNVIISGSLKSAQWTSY